MNIAGGARRVPPSTAVLLASTGQVLVPVLRDRPDAIVALDNLPAHPNRIAWSKGWVQDHLLYCRTMPQEPR